MRILEFKASFLVWYCIPRIIFTNHLFLAISLRTLTCLFTFWYVVLRKNPIVLTIVRKIVFKKAQFLEYSHQLFLLYKIQVHIYSDLTFTNLVSTNLTDKFTSSSYSTNVKDIIPSLSLFFFSYHFLLKYFIPIK